MIVINFLYIKTIYGTIPIILLLKLVRAMNYNNICFEMYKNNAKISPLQPTSKL